MKNVFKIIAVFALVTAGVGSLFGQKFGDIDKNADYPKAGSIGKLYIEASSYVKNATGIVRS